jgi:predicted O-methyltransferase YrrM
MTAFARITDAMSFANTMLRVKALNGDESPSKLVRLAMGSQFIRPYQIPEEFEQFAALVAKRSPRFMMEIGTFRGGTLFVLSRLAAPDAKIIYLDRIHHSRLRRTLFQAFPTRRGMLAAVVGDSHDPGVLANVRAKLQGNTLDMLFIDGDHSYEGVRQDFEMYSPLVRPGGMVAFHDIVEHPPEAQCDVFRLWNELKLRYEHTEIVKQPTPHWGGIGVLFV